MSETFYQAFEARHRGPRALIKQRLEVYLPFVKQLHSLYPQGTALDLGCGRGEWLELLKELHVDARGVDLDPGMLSECSKLGLSVSANDILVSLQALTKNSQMLISGFHVAEHLAFEELKRLIAEALRTLQPGGLLILETPNPENLVVGTANFYLDPTHQRPIPHPLLTFLADYYGFARVKLLRLQEAPEVCNNATPSLLNVLNGVSPDYAVIAQKKAPKKLLAVFDGLFAQEFGISMETLATRYEHAMQQNFMLTLESVQQTIQQNFTPVLTLAQQSMQQTIHSRQLLEVQLRQAEIQLVSKVSEIQHLTAELLTKNATIHQLETQLANSIHATQRLTSSYSWRITLPLRIITRPIRAILKKTSNFLHTTDKWLVNYPMLRYRLKTLLRHYPSIYAFILQSKDCFSAYQPPATDSTLTTASYPFTPTERIIYNTLKQALLLKEQR